MINLVVGWINILLVLYGLTALAGGASHSRAPIYRVDLIWWDALAFLNRNVFSKQLDIPDEYRAYQNVTDLLSKHGYDDLPALVNACYEWEANIRRNRFLYGYSDRIRAKKYSSSVRELLYKRAGEYARRKAWEERASQANREYFRARHSWNSKPGHTPKPDTSSWRSVLGLTEGERNPSAIKLAARKLIRRNHPDHGGRGDKIHLYTKALDEAKAELGFK